MHIIVTLIIGAVVGWLASILMRANSQMGILANIVVGIVGSSLGQWLAGGLGVSGSAMWWIASVAGASLLIAVLRYFGIFNRLAAASR